LRNLEVLNIKKNKIEELPDILLNLRKLKVLFIDDGTIKKNKGIIKKLMTNGIKIL